MKQAEQRRRPVALPLLEAALFVFDCLIALRVIWLLLHH